MPRGQQDHEELDPTPIEIGPRFERPESLESMMHRFFAGMRENASQEDLDEIDDFEEEDPDTLNLTDYQLAALEVDELLEVGADYGLDPADFAYEEAPQEGAQPPTREPTGSEAETEGARGKPSEGPSGDEK